MRSVALALLCLLLSATLTHADEIAETIDQAIIRWEAGEEGEAEAALDALVEAHPRDSRPAWHLANLLRRHAFRFEDAIEVLENLLRRQPGDTHAVELLVRIAEDALHSGLPYVSQYGATVLRQFEPGEKAHRYLWARAAYRSGETSSVIGACKDLMTDFPSYASAYRLHGRVLESLGRYEEAVAIYQKLLLEWPGDTEAKWRAATVLLWNVRDYDRAEEAYRSVLDSAEEGSAEQEEADRWLKKVTEERDRSEGLRDRLGFLRGLAVGLFAVWALMTFGLYVWTRPRRE